MYICIWIYIYILFMGLLSKTYQRKHTLYIHICIYVCVRLWGPVFTSVFTSSSSSSCTHLLEHIVDLLQGRPHGAVTAQRAFIAIEINVGHSIQSVMTEGADHWGSDRPVFVLIRRFVQGGIISGVNVFPSVWLQPLHGGSWQNRSDLNIQQQQLLQQPDGLSQKHGLVCLSLCPDCGAWCVMFTDVSSCHWFKLCSTQEAFIYTFHPWDHWLAAIG